MFVSCVVDKVQMTAGRTRKQFKKPLRIIDASVISLCLAKYNRSSCRKAKRAVKLHLNPDGDNLMPCDACLSAGKVYDVHGMAELCDELRVIYVPSRGYVDYKSLYNIDLQRQAFVTRMKRNGAYKRIKNNRHEENGVILYLKIKNFWGTGENAVFSRIWAAHINRYCYGYAERLTG